jgi:DNA invertase Pin-like site-specific DNA recombinase
MSLSVMRALSTRDPEKHMATTVVGYLRPHRGGDSASSASNDADADHEALRRYAAERALELRHVYADRPGRGAVRGPRGERSGFAAALADVRERRADGVLLLDVADLSWHPDIRDSLAYLVADAGGQLFVAEEPGRDPAAGGRGQAPRAQSGR